MRLPAVRLPLIAAALFAEDPEASAQSANSYSWCAIYYKDGGGTRDATSPPVSSARHQSRASAAFVSRIYNIALGCSRPRASPGASPGST